MASVFKAGTAATGNKGKRKASEVDESSAQPSAAAAAATPAKPVRRNKQRTLILPSRGVTMRMRHLVNDIESLLPHSKKDSKLDSKSDLHILNELAELNNCNNTLYFEARKHTDLYLWASKTPNGPSAKLHIQNIHTMDELKMTGNCLKGSRHLLSFDKTFDEVPYWGIMKELLSQSFGVPTTARRSKPFIDHVLTFSILDGKIWFRNYQILPAESDPGASALAAAEEAAQEAAGRGKAGKGKPSKSKKGEAKPPTLVEIGPRFVMTPIRIFEGSFGGATLYENPTYISPNTVRHEERRKQGVVYKERSTATANLEAKRQRLQDEKVPDALATSRVFA